MCLELALFQNALAARNVTGQQPGPLATNRPCGPASLQPRSAEDLSFLCGSTWHTSGCGQHYVNPFLPLPHREAGSPAQP